ncbi:hypothetical protein FHW74_000234 [Atlantibacter sp. RC6]|nr:hypothetical protein [Atlantibacter sp. RC6]
MDGSRDGKSKTAGTVQSIINCAMDNTGGLVWIG